MILVTHPILPGVGPGNQKLCICPSQLLFVIDIERLSSMMISLSKIHCVMLLSEIQNAATKASETDHLHESVVVRQCVCMRACVIVCEVETCASVWL